MTSVGYLEISHAGIIYNRYSPQMKSFLHRPESDQHSPAPTSVYVYLNVSVCVCVKQEYSGISGHSYGRLYVNRE